ncbi:hypothetical protein LJC24_02455 [Desulfococcaceae bacterium OttesenSCG-928-F15]|nr:hypothetical protein [Desulfococcaceae bacterium OttesenSCG-928-F15]
MFVRLICIMGGRLKKLAASGLNGCQREIRNDLPVAAIWNKRFTPRLDRQQTSVTKLHQNIKKADQTLLRCDKIIASVILQTLLNTPGSIGQIL